MSLGSSSVGTLMLDGSRREEEIDQVRATTMLSLSFGFVLLRPGCSTPLLTWDDTSTYATLPLHMHGHSFNFLFPIEKKKKKSSHL